jgi:hypothetical protein
MYFALLRLQVPDEVPAELREVGERVALAHELLHVVLAEIALPAGRRPRAPGLGLESSTPRRG